MKHSLVALLPIQKFKMEEIEQQINLLTNQIEDVCSDIETIECVLAKDFGDWSQQEKRKYGKSKKATTQKGRATT